MRVGGWYAVSCEDCNYFHYNDYGKDGDRNAEDYHLHEFPLWVHGLGREELSDDEGCSQPEDKEDFNVERPGVNHDEGNDRCPDEKDGCCGSDFSGCHIWVIYGACQ
ncbi:MAG: hypothetical protein Q4A15_10500 [Prevotellaceae bacterium]|nr:hypothetical protein [Prevotellaceae bacterium]